ncbi:MAG: hypothetical protein HY606_04660 [Planctomycetes bacterium]|nr:hypothetical protein [Planctomycetota bacterium]
MEFLKGFIDHTTPIMPDMSKFWKSDFKTVKKMFDMLSDEIDFNNFTIYSKWYTNGVKSNLPFLPNNPEATMVKTDNQFLRDIISYLHERSISVGLMLQLYTYEKKGWENIPDWGDGEVKHVAGTDVVVADPLDSEMPRRLSQLIDEQIKLFPDVDYVFIEGEGCDTSAGFLKYLKKNYSALNYSGKIKGYCNELGIQLKENWSEEGFEILRDIDNRTLQIAKRVLSDNNFKGKYGWVYHAYSTESQIVEQIVKDKDCLLLPWAYFGCEDRNSKYYRTRIETSKKHLAKMHDLGYSIIYIGDATMGCNLDYEVIRELYNYCKGLGFYGYLAMGPPDIEIGLRWQKVTSEMVRSSRELYKELYK